MAYYASEMLIKKWQRNHMGTAAGIDVLLVTITYNQFKFTEDIRKINRIKVINIVCTISMENRAGDIMPQVFTDDIYIRFNTGDKIFFFIFGHDSFSFFNQ